MHRINLVKSRIRNEMQALMAKAEANGIQIDVPMAARLTEQSQATEMRSAKQHTADTAREAKGLSEVHRRMKIVIDGDRPDQPVRFERELPRSVAMLGGIGHPCRII